MTKYGRTKKIPEQMTWHHKSCGQCGHIPGYSTSIFWLNRQFGMNYVDPTDQTSCTAWNYYASATSNAVAQAGGRGLEQLRSGLRNRLLPDDPLRHQLRALQGDPQRACPPSRPSPQGSRTSWRSSTSRLWCRRRSSTTRSGSMQCGTASRSGKPATSRASQHRSTQHATTTSSSQRTRSTTLTSTAGSAPQPSQGPSRRVGSTVGDYSTFFDCCGFGFRHILVQRDFSHDLLPPNARSRS